MTNGDGTAEQRFKRFNFTRLVQRQFSLFNLFTLYLCLAEGLQRLLRGFRHSRRV
jgi:hypothetical protein